MPVILLGAGIGGLTAANALVQRGISVKVFEQAPAPLTGGSGITLAINAMRVFKELGLDAAIEVVGAPFTRGMILDASGRILQDLKLGDLGASYGVRGVAVHRTQLSRVLTEALPLGTVTYGAELEEISQDPQGVRLVFAGGMEVNGAALVGADGIHSQVREFLFGDCRLRYSGQTCWRGVSDVASPYAQEGLIEVWGPAGLRVGMVPIGHGRSYWFVTENTPAGGRDGDAVAEMKSRLVGFTGFTKSIQAILDGTADVIRRDLYDLAPIASWTSGRITLLGDAAHAMTPNLGQGAGQAIEDGMILASALSSITQTDAALARYEEVRRPRARRVVERSWTMGKIATWENRTAQSLRNLAIRLTPEWVMQKSLADVFDVRGL